MKYIISLFALAVLSAGCECTWKDRKCTVAEVYVCVGHKYRSECRILCEEGFRTDVDILVAKGDKINIRVRECPNE